MPRVANKASNTKSQAKKPRVSVLTPIYNTNPDHLRECIESILGQTFTDFEFIIVNDSPENRELDKIINSYKDARIRYVRNEKNIGISASRNKLLALARGEYIAIFDHDDVSMPDRLASQVEILDKNPAIGVVGGFLEYFDGDRVLDIWRMPEFDDFIKMQMTGGCACAHTAAMIRRAVLDENNIKYEEYYTPDEDYRLWGRLMHHTRFYNIQRVIVRYRAAQTRTSIRQATRMARISDEIRLQIRNDFPEYWRAYKHADWSKCTIFRARLFGRIPLIKIKKNRVYLFEFIPLLRLKWE